MQDLKRSRQASEKLSTAEERVVAGELCGPCTMSVMHHGQAPGQYCVQSWFGN